MMKYVFNAYMIHSNKKGTDYYYVSLDLVDEFGKVVRKGSPILWITEEQFTKLTNISK